MTEIFQSLSLISLRDLCPMLYRSCSASTLASGPWNDTLSISWLHIRFNTIGSPPTFQWLHLRESVKYNAWPQYEQEDYDLWLDRIVAHVKDNPQKLHPSVKHLRDIVNRSTRLTQLVQGMYHELSLRKMPHGKRFPFRSDVHDAEHMFQVLNYLLTVPALWSSYRYLVSWLGCPILCLFWRPLHTTCDFAFFRTQQSICT